MKIELKLEPFHHIIVEDMYDDEGYKIIFDELHNLNVSGRFETAEKTISATINKKLLKKNLGMFFGDDYNLYMQETFNQFMAWFHDNLLNDIKKKSWFFSGSLPPRSEVLISYYEGGDYYKPHQDASAITWLRWFNKEPKKFTGGDLYFPEFDYTIEYKNNTAVAFYSRLVHQVTEIQMEPTDESSCGRFCITNFMCGD